MKKIAFVIKSMNIKGGGAERVLSIVFNKIIEDINPNNLDVRFYTLDSSWQSFYNINDLNRVNAVGSDSCLFGKFLSYIRLIYLLYKYEPNFVVAFNMSSYIPCAILPFFNGNIKIIASEHSTYEAVGRSIYKKILLYLANYNIRVYTILSSNVLQTFPKFIRDKSYIVPDPVVIPSGNYEKSNIYEKKYFNIISVGRLAVEKNHAVLIKAFRQVVKCNPNARLYIFGDGILKMRLINYINKLEISDSAFILSSVKDLNQIYNGAQLFCLPSLYEGFGLAAAEALAYKIPVIGFNDCVGLRDLVISNQTGHLLERERPSDEILAQTINNYISNPGEYNRIKENCTLSKKYSAEEVLKLWLKLLEINVSDL